MLFAVAAARRGLPRVKLEYFAVAVFVTVAASNVIFFSTVFHVGASFVALATAFPPTLVYPGALALRIEPFDAIRATGVAAALAGAVVLAATLLLSAAAAIPGLHVALPPEPWAIGLAGLRAPLFAG